ncbi:SpoIIIAH-like family protein [Anaerovorax odorimutans]|uniref:SpoIIIAH-like family protein n=1 Tax=Anaerovorax odorimutans TaxID=109327 RepID=A0ABT1RL25_9FIRM|nr:SpoIIIAH-like family protein [Anaerovorax odorimutans]MCQ4635887.1 SpoIIIAH-like family protein [Anaerovorax odorimutans]
MKKHNLWEKIKKHRKLISGALVVALCLGIVGAIGGVFPSPKAAQSNQDIPEHDGDVLVDSINVKNETETSAKESKKETKASKESELVTSDDVSDLENTDTYFEEMRATINMDRNQVISMLTDAETTAENSSEKESATQQKLKLLKYMEQEQNAENAIKTKNLPECLVLITDSGVNVTVNKQDLNQSDVAKICDVIMRETGRKAPEIVIQSKF